MWNEHKNQNKKIKHNLDFEFSKSASRTLAMFSFNLADFKTF